MMLTAGRKDHATARVAVVDPLPLFREGAEVVLAAAGHQVETPADLAAWAARHRSAMVLLTMIGAAEWELLNALWRTPVIALIDGGSPPDGARAVRAGACSVLPRGVAPDTLRRTVEATLEGQTVLPVAVTQLLTSGDARSRAAIDTERLAWLGKLAAGSTVAQLAGQVGYSERAMFRLLAALYQEMGVRSRIEAVVLARDRGWI